MIKRLGLYRAIDATSTDNAFEAEESNSEGSTEERRLCPPLSTENASSFKIAGKYLCKLCPTKTFLVESDLEKHLTSKLHCKRERMFESQEQDATNIASKADLSAPETLKSSNKNTRKMKKRRNPSNLSSEQIQKRKRLFQLKKQRRKKRKALVSK